jgi:hypothetical protein
VLLYELLTGTMPFDKERFKQAVYAAIRRIIPVRSFPRFRPRGARISETLSVREGGYYTNRVRPGLATGGIGSSTSQA